MSKANAQSPAPEEAAATEQATGTPVEYAAGSMKKYLDRALGVFEKLGLPMGDQAPVELATLLEEVRHLDEAKVLAILQTIKHMSAFNALVRENVEDIQVGNRYMTITQLFDSIRDDSKNLIAQLDDGRISMPEKMSNWWMWLRRGSPQARFEKIVENYKEVSADTKEQLKREQAIMDAYIDFRFALKEAESLSRELFEKQGPILEAAQEGLAAAQEALDNYAGEDDSERSKLEMARDEAHRKYQDEDRNYQLVKDVVENLSIGYDVGETLVTKLKQTHDVKEQVYRRSVTFFTTNEHVFTILGAVYTSQHGLHEATQSTEAMKAGVNKGLEDVADLGRDLERAALKAGYGSTIDPKSVEKLVDAISSYQIESLKMITKLREESEENAKEIRRVVEAGKQKYQKTLAKFAREGAEGLEDTTPAT